MPSETSTFNVSAGLQRRKARDSSPFVGEGFVRLVGPTAPGLNGTVLTNTARRDYFPSRVQRAHSIPFSWSRVAARRRSSGSCAAVATTRSREVPSGTVGGRMA